MRNKLFLFFAAIFWTITIIVLSLIAINQDIDPLKIPNKDKIVHFMFYFIFVILWYSYFKNENFHKKYGLMVVVVAIIFGILIEICQATLTTSRQGDPMDVLANSTGAILGIIFSILWYKRRKKQY